MQATTPVNVLQEAAEGVKRLLKLLKKSKTAQVKSKEEQQIIKATALAWFNNHRNALAGVDPNLFKAVEVEYTALFEATSHATMRDRYLDTLKKLRASIITLQTQTLASPSSAITAQISKPDFSPLVPDARMRQILENRWDEIIKCLECGAPLAATIMMGGLLEALFLAQVNRATDKGPIFKARAAPKDRVGKTLPLNDWTLNAYIEVGAELEWITKPGKDIGVVLRDYRNFVHPEREVSTGITLTPDDAAMFWSVCTRLIQQIISKTK